MSDKSRGVATPPQGAPTASASREHDLKCWTEFFDKLLSGEKTFEARFNDRNFRVGDILRLRDWDKAGQAYTGREMRREVTYILNSAARGVQAGWVIMALAPLAAPEPLREALRLRMLWTRFVEPEIKSAIETAEGILARYADVLDKNLHEDDYGALENLPLTLGGAMRGFTSALAPAAPKAAPPADADGPLRDREVELGRQIAQKMPTDWLTLQADPWRWAALIANSLADYRRELAAGTLARSAPPATDAPNSVAVLCEPCPIGGHYRNDLGVTFHPSPCDTPKAPR